MIVIPGAACGSFVGGAVAKVFKLTIRGLLRMCIILAILTTFMIFGFLFGCNHNGIVGITTPYTDEM